MISEQNTLPKFLIIRLFNGLQQNSNTIVVGKLKKVGVCRTLSITEKKSYYHTLQVHYD